MKADRYTFDNLWRAYRTCRRTKRNTRNALRFEVDAEANLLQLQQELRDHTYTPGRSICFVTNGPKPREVFAADFRDRVVHHLLVPQDVREVGRDAPRCARLRAVAIVAPSGPPPYQGGVRGGCCGTPCSPPLVRGTIGAEPPVVPPW